MIDALLSLGIVEAGVGAVVGGAIAHVLSRRRHRRQIVDEWYRESAGHAARYRRFGRRVTEYQDTADYELFLDLIEPLTDDVADHVGRGRKMDVPEAAVHELEILNQFATGLPILVQQLGEEETAAFLDRTRSQSMERLGDRAQEIDIEDLSGFLGNFDMAEIERRSGLDPEDFDEATAERIIESVDGQELAPAVKAVWGESVEFPEDGEWDTQKGVALSQVLQLNLEEVGEHLDPAMDATMTEYIRAIMIEYAGEVAAQMEERRV